MLRCGCTFTWPIRFEIDLHDDVVGARCLAPALPVFAGKAGSYRRSRVTVVLLFRAGSAMSRLDRSTR